MAIRFVDLVFQIRSRRNGRLPRFRGTTYRGAFGYALKKTVCIVRHGNCGDCFLRSRCAFPNVFEGVPPTDRTFMRKYPYIPQPFVIRAEREQPDVVQADQLEAFTIRLFGPAIDFYPYVVVAVERMLETGLGRDHIPFDLVDVSDGESSVFNAGRPGDLRQPATRLLELKPHSSDVQPVELRLEFVTPTRIRTDGAINASPDLSAVLRAAARRLRILNHFYGDGSELPEDIGPVLQAADNARRVNGSLSEFTIQRRSKRQNTQMPLSGFVGCVDYELDDALPISWLLMAQETNVGKATSFGFGRFTCTVRHP